jgi:hypothetical protein
MITLVRDSNWIEATFSIEPQPIPKFWIGYRTEEGEYFVFQGRLERKSAHRSVTNAPSIKHH